MKSEKKAKIKVKGLNGEEASKFADWFELTGIIQFNAWLCSNSSTTDVIIVDSVDEEDNEFVLHLSKGD